jgi:transcriptional regulator with XRE-family HTH domain
MEVFVQRLIGGRNRKGFTQTELAKELGVHLRSIQNWEGGLTEPRGKDLRKLSHVLGMSIPFLYGMDEEEGAGKGFRIEEVGGEVRQRAHEYLEKVLDACHGDRDREAWTLVELKKRLPVPSSGADAVAGELLSKAKASGRRRGRGSSR